MYVNLIIWPTCEFGSSTNVTTRQDLCLDSWWTRPGCSVKKIIGQNWTQVCEFEGQSLKMEKFTSNHFHCILTYFCCVINQASLAMSSAMPSSQVLMESQWLSRWLLWTEKNAMKSPKLQRLMWGLKPSTQQSWHIWGTWLWCPVSQLEGQDVCRWLGFPKAGVPAVLTQRCWEWNQITRFLYNE